MVDLMNALRAFLDAQGSGSLGDREGLIARLGPVWPDLAGSDDEAMEPHKLGRLDIPVWCPPVLTFLIERHGGLVLGSTRADKQTWTVNLDARTAIPVTHGYRQILPMAPRLYVGPLAAAVVRLVVDGDDHADLKWSADR